MMNWYGVKITLGMVTDGVNTILLGESCRASVPREQQLGDREGRGPDHYQDQPPALLARRLHRRA
jgi:hypothetical protein